MSSYLYPVQNPWLVALLLGLEVGVENPREATILGVVGAEVAAKVRICDGVVLCRNGHTARAERRASITVERMSPVTMSRTWVDCNDRTIQKTSEDY